MSLITDSAIQSELSSAIALTNFNLLSNASQVKDSSSNNSISQVKEKFKKIGRPARVQVEQGEVKKKELAQSGQVYNLWYNKWAGGDMDDGYSNKEHAQTRVQVKRDSGYTQADKVSKVHVCLFFARGCCPYGSSCQWLHRLPNPLDFTNDLSLDCFAREKFADYRDDMGGVGSFTRQNLTLYIGRLREQGQQADTEAVVRRHFEEFGEIIRLRVLHNRGVAFVTYKYEQHAQFAREAMACQSLDDEEILNVRWATEDPNPTAIQREKRKLLQDGIEGVTKKLAGNHELVDAVRRMEALENGTPLAIEGEEDSDNDEDDDEDLQAATMAELERESAAEEASKSKASASLPIIPQNGLMSSSVLTGLAQLAQVRKEQILKAPPPKAKGLAGVAAYDSDSDE